MTERRLFAAALYARRENEGSFSVSFAPLVTMGRSLEEVEEVGLDILKGSRPISDGWSGYKVEAFEINLGVFVENPEAIIWKPRPGDSSGEIRQVERALRTRAALLEIEEEKA